MMKDNSQPLIVVKDVKKYYKGEVIKALDGINLTINEGEVVVIIGPVSYTHLVHMENFLL